MSPNETQSGLAVPMLGVLSVLMMTGWMIFH